MDIDERIVALQVNLESLHSSLAHLVETTQATEGRIDKLTGHMTNLMLTMDRLVNIS